MAVMNTAINDSRVLNNLKHAVSHSSTNDGRFVGQKPLPFPIYSRNVSIRCPSVVVMKAPLPSTMFITTPWEQWSLSVNYSRLETTLNVGASLYLYGDDGNELHHIELPRYMDATHAMETTINTYIVSHGNRIIEDTSSQCH